jgi:hypothetical protein
LSHHKRIPRPFLACRHACSRDIQITNRKGREQGRFGRVVLPPSSSSSGKHFCSDRRGGGGWGGLFGPCFS